MYVCRLLQISYSALSLGGWKRNDPLHTEFMKLIFIPYLIINWIMAGQRPETIRWTCYLPLYADWFEVWTKCTHCWPITICHPICVCSSMGYFMGRAGRLKEKVRKLLNVGEWVHRKDITLQWQIGDLSGKEKHTGGVEVKKGGQEIEKT